MQFEIIYLIHSQKLKAEDAPFLVFVFSSLNNLFWTAYGLRPGNPYISFVSNIAGCFFGYIAFSLYILLLKERSKESYLSVGILAFAYFGIFSLSFEYMSDSILGGITVINNILLFAGPISNIVE